MISVCEIKEENRVFLATSLTTKYSVCRGVCVCFQSENEVSVLRAFPVLNAIIESYRGNVGTQRRAGVEAGAEPASWSDPNLPAENGGGVRANVQS